MMQNKFTKLFLAFIAMGLFPAQNARAEFSFSSFNNISLTLGNWLEYYGQVQTTKSSDQAKLEFTPYLGIGIEYDIDERSSLIPEIGYVIQRKAGDDNITKDLFFLRADYSYKLKSWLDLRLGTSFMVLTISSNGGEEELPNGDGTETYYLPSERRTALNQTIDFGAESVYDKYSFRFHTYVYSIFNSDKRMYTYSLSVSYLLGPKEL